VKRTRVRMSVAIPDVLAKRMSNDEALSRETDIWKAISEWAGVTPAELNPAHRNYGEAWRKVAETLAGLLPCFHGARQKRLTHRRGRKPLEQPPRGLATGSNPHSTLVLSVEKERAAWKGKRPLSVRRACEKLLKSKALPKRYLNRKPETLRRLFQEVQRFPGLLGPAKD
jgi:hypothetical protein